LIRRIWKEVNRVLDFGFDDLNLHRIQAGCAMKLGSIKVLERQNVQKDRKATTTLDQVSDNFEYAI
jgi:hypothetical protein